MTVSPGGAAVAGMAGARDAVSVAAGGVRYCVRRFGPATSATPAAPAALLLHDVAGGLEDWDVIVGELVAYRCVLAVSPKGLGASEDRDPYTGDVLAAELAALVLHAVDGPVDVVGHGTGASLAWNLAARRPDLVRRVVLISGGRALASWAVASLLLGAARVREGASARSSPGEAARRCRICAAYARLEPIGRISPQRAMVLWGTRDPVSPLAVAQRILESLTRTVAPETVRMVTLPGVGRRPLAESPERCAALVSGFLHAP